MEGSCSNDRRQEQEQQYGTMAATTVAVELSREKQQQLVDILAMLQSSTVPTMTAATTAQKNDNIDRNNNDVVHNHPLDDQDNNEEAEYEGEYNSCEEGSVINEEISEDDDVVEIEGGWKSREATSERKPSLNRMNSGMLAAATTSTSSRNSYYYYGKPKFVQSIGQFPELGSILGPYFCLGQLGKGTFSSIHKCINMNYFHEHAGESTSSSSARFQLSSSSSNNKVHRLAAAKVELVTFQQSGVLEAEATILDYLHTNLPAGTVPYYMGHYKSEQFAAIFMEYLPGEDMHQLREHVMARTLNEYNAATTAENNNLASNTSPPTRRINVNDAVYLTADVMLPLLQSMHSVGVVHRDVKPSNCVRAATGSKSKQFCMVDFGLSKSIIVPEDSEFADREHYWDDTAEWLKPYVHQNTKSTNPPRGCYRIERKKADFRGTSMYASLRVHQCKDYCPRDDVWSLLYVFCDLVTGGLPWMQHAASRDREACQRYKERVHGEVVPEDAGATRAAPEIAELLKGDLYHKAVYQREKSIEAGIPEEKLPPLPSPLAMCEETTKISLLTTAFQHVASLKFWEKPNYGLIQECIRGFARGSNSKDPIIRPIDWAAENSSFSTENHQKRQHERGKVVVPGWQYADDHDPLDDLHCDIFDEHEELAESQRNPEDFMTRIPLQLRFKIEQMNYNLAVARSSSVSRSKVPLHRAFHDWIQVTIDMLYKEWDSKRYEHGGHRTALDGFKRECYLQVLEKCRSYENQFENFGSRDIIYFHPVHSHSVAGHQQSEGSSDHLDAKINGDRAPLAKRRKVLLQNVSEFTCSHPSDLVLVSRCIFGLEAAIKAEQAKKTAPPVRISFG